MNIRKNDGTSIKYILSDIDSVWFTEKSKPIDPDTTFTPIDSINRSSLFLPGFIRENLDINDASIFYNALIRTHLCDTLTSYYDVSYPIPGSDSTFSAFKTNGRTSVSVRTLNGQESVVYPERRIFKFTVFLVSNSTLSSLYGINNVDDLRSFAESIYPEGTGLDDVDRASSLNKLIAYHILPIELTPSQLNPSESQIINNRYYLDELDVEDFYETLLPHSIMRISTAYEDGRPIGTYINRKGTSKQGKLLPGTKITLNSYDNKDTIAINGCYYLIDSLLCYNAQTRQALLTRIRVMATTLSPDFINSGSRGRMGTNPENLYYVGFKSNYCQNFEWSNNTQLYVKYRDVSSPALYGDEIVIGGIADVFLRLPSVPKSDTYEIRIWNNATNYSGIYSFFFAGSNKDWAPTDIPIDFRKSSLDPIIGYVADSDYDNLAPDQKEEAIQVNDKKMRNRGYMKSPDIYRDNRDNPNCYRKIIGSLFMNADEDYYLRIRGVSNKSEQFFSFSFIELVPTEVFAGKTAEDRH